MLIRIICSRFTIILLKIKGKCWRMSCAQSFDKQRSWLNEAKVGKELIRWNITACSDRNGQAKQKKRGGALRARWTDEGRVSRRQINQKDIKGKWAEGGKEWKSADRLSHAVPAPLRLSLLSDLRAIVPHGCMEGAGAQRTQYTHKHTHTHTNVWEKKFRCSGSRFWLLILLILSCFSSPHTWTFQIKAFGFTSTNFAPKHKHTVTHSLTHPVCCCQRELCRQRWLVAAVVGALW